MTPEVTYVQGAGGGLRGNAHASAGGGGGGSGRHGRAAAAAAAAAATGAAAAGSLAEAGPRISSSRAGRMRAASPEFDGSGVLTGTGRATPAGGSVRDGPSSSSAPLRPGTAPESSSLKRGGGGQGPHSSSSALGGANQMPNLYEHGRPSTAGDLTQRTYGHGTHLPDPSTSGRTSGRLSSPASRPGTSGSRASLSRASLGGGGGGGGGATGASWSSFVESTRWGGAA